MFVDYNRINHICLVFLAGVALTGSLYYTRDMLIPFTIAIFLYVVGAPAVMAMEKYLRLPHFLAVSLTVILFLLLAVLFVISMSYAVRSLFAELSSYEATWRLLWKNLREYGEFLGLPGETLRTMQSDSAEIWNFARFLTGKVTVLAGNILLIMALFVFIIPHSNQKALPTVLREVLDNFFLYLVNKFFISLGTGFVEGMVLFLFDVKLAFSIGALTVVLCFIPVFGGFLAVLLPLPLIYLLYGPSWQTVTMLSLFTVMQVFVGQFLEPRTFGGQLALHPATILLSLIFWGGVWGLGGLFLAVPITAALRIGLSKIAITQPVAELMAGRWSTQDQAGVQT